MEELAWLKSALLAVYPLFIVDYQEFGIWPYVGGIRRARVRDIEESEDNRSMSVGVDLHKPTFNAAVVDDETSWGLRGHEPDELGRFSESLPAGSTVIMESSSP